MKYGFYPGCSYKSAAGYSHSVDAVNTRLGIELIEISDWNCCGATAVFSLDESSAMSLVVRIFAQAQAQGLTEIITVCNACYTTLRKAGKAIDSRPEILDLINNRLSPEGLELEKSIPVRHYLEVLVNDVPRQVWAQNLQESPSDIAVAGYYGCQLTRPWGDMDRVEYPSILERLIEILGFRPVEHSAKTLCCGASHAMPYFDECKILISRIIREAQKKGADVITAICPMCQFNLDAGQRGLDMPAMPVPYFTQLAGLAMGLNPSDLGLNKLLVPMNRVMQSIRKHG